MPRSARMPRRDSLVASRMIDRDPVPPTGTAPVATMDVVVIAAVVVVVGSH